MEHFLSIFIDQLNHNKLSNYVIWKIDEQNQVSGAEVRKEKSMEKKKEVVEFLKNEKDIVWLTALTKFIGSHIEYLEFMNDLEKHLKEKEQN